MKKFNLLIILALGAVGCQDAVREKEQEVEPQAEIQDMEKVSQEKDWIVLFDGKNLDQWKAFNSDTITQWKVEDGAIVFTPVEGESKSENLITKETFTNFELELDWKISEGGNSGVMWAVQEEEKYNEPYLTGPEIQILDNQGHPDAENGPIRQAGALYDLSSPTADLTKPAGEWNKMVIRINYEENQGTVWLNGEEVNKFPLQGEAWEDLVEKSKFSDWEAFAKAQTGHISLQDHSDKVAYRNIRIREL